jgi:hypothetical protein
MLRGPSSLANKRVIAFGSGGGSIVKHQLGRQHLHAPRRRRVRGWGGGAGAGKVGEDGLHSAWVPDGGDDAQPAAGTTKQMLHEREAVGVRIEKSDESLVLTPEGHVNLTAGGCSRFCLTPNYKKITNLNFKSPRRMS